MPTQPQDLIKSYQTLKELNADIANTIINDLVNPGLILLPAGNTFEQGIYPLVNEFFKYDEYKIIDTKAQEEVFQAQHHKIHPKAKVSHLDELIDIPEKFSRQIQNALPDLCKQLKENFHAIDINDISSFERFINYDGGPKSIYLGLGADPELAHVAFIGEEFLNSPVTQVTLSQEMQDNLHSQKAITIGTDIFKASNLQRIIVVAKGKNKAASIQAGFNDPDTGLGYLIKNHSDKLLICADHDALSQ